MKQFKNVITSFFLGLTLVIAVIAGLLGFAVEPTRAAGPDNAYIVVQFGDNNAIVRPISFNAPISGLKALEMTGLRLVTSSAGAVCAIEGVGDSVANCFGTGFWAYSFWNGSTWESHSSGAGSTVVSDGAIELWAWSPAPSYASPASPGSGPQFVGAAKALDWLKTQQNTTNGSYGSDPNYSIEVLLALEANKLKGNEWGNPSLFSYIFGNSITFSKKHAGAAGKLAIGVTAEGSCWLREAKSPLDYYDAGTGKFSTGSLFHSWAMLGTHALSQTVPAKAVEYLQSLQKANGGWAWATTEGPDTNSTAVAIQALLVAGESVSATAVVSGLTYLDNAQINDDGGFPYDPNSSFGKTSDTNSTAYVIQALLAAGEVPTSTRWTTGGGATPLSYLLNRQLPDGSFEWQAGQGTDLVATQQAIPALLGKSFPLQQSELNVCPTTFLPVLLKN